jgi:hypothetical protein
VPEIHRLEKEKQEERMIQSVHKNKKNTIFIMALLVTFLSLCAVGLDAGVCEGGLSKCVWENSFGGYLGTGYCLIGYFFCKKYVDK